MMILVCDGCLQIKRYLAPGNLKFMNHPANRIARFLRLGTQWPIELQMMLGQRVAGRGGAVIIWKMLRRAMAYGIVMLKR